MLSKLYETKDKIENFVLTLHKQYENYVPVFFFSFGFILDVFTLGEVDDFSNILMLSLYLFIMLGILFAELRDKPLIKINHPIWPKIQQYKIDIFHFLLGSLLSAFTLFYFKSSSFFNSFIFMFVMMVLLFANELQIVQKKGLMIKVALSSLCLISYLIYIIPIIFGMVNDWIFYLCLIIAIALSFLSYKVVNLNLDIDKKVSLKKLLLPQSLVIFLFFILYTLRVFPPIPLSLKHIGIYHEVTKEKIGIYKTSESRPWWNFWDNGDQNFLARPNDKIYVFTKIFSPGGFSEKINMHWLYEVDGDFKTSDRIPLEITGGRSEGFRGFSFKENYQEGNWQVRIETENGLEIGRIYFSVKQVQSDYHLEFKTKYQ